MSKFKLEPFNHLNAPAYRLLFKGEQLGGYIMASDLPALYACVGAAMAESNTAVMSGSQEFIYADVRGPAVCGDCNGTFINKYTNKRCRCTDEACHQPQEPARGGNEQ